MTKIEKMPITRFTVQYWYQDEHDSLSETFDTINKARKFASEINLVIFKDISINPHLWYKVPNPFEHNSIIYDDWTWELWCPLPSEVKK